MLTELSKNGQGSESADLSEEELAAKLHPDRMPRHLAVIMDGNGRWATRRGLPRPAGHRAGIESFRQLTLACAELNIEVLTVYAFSTENWDRPAEEVSFLFDLLEETLDRYLDELHENGVKVRAIGRRAGLPPKLAKRIASAEEITSKNDRLTLNVGLNYGGRAEIVDAAKRAIELALEGKLRTEDVTEPLFGSLMYTGDLPDPDLLIRTGGEHRVSNFLLWQLAYAELWVTPVYWPDFRRIHLLQALVDFQKRDRRFGRV